MYLNFDDVPIEPNEHMARHFEEHMERLKDFTDRLETFVNKKFDGLTGISANKKSITVYSKDTLIIDYISSILDKNNLQYWTRKNSKSTTFFLYRNSLKEL